MDTVKDILDISSTALLLGIFYRLGVFAHKWDDHEKRIHLIERVMKKHLNLALLLPALSVSLITSDASAMARRVTDADIQAALIRLEQTAETDTGKPQSVFEAMAAEPDFIETVATSAGNIIASAATSAGATTTATTGIPILGHVPTWAITGLSSLIALWTERRRRKYAVALETAVKHADRRLSTADKISINAEALTRGVAPILQGAVDRVTIHSAILDDD